MSLAMKFEYKDDDINILLHELGSVYCGANTFLYAFVQDNFVWRGCIHPHETERSLYSTGIL